MSEDKKAYLSSYYETHKDKILQNMKKPIECELCGHMVSHCYLTKHQTTGICNRRREKSKQHLDLLEEIKLINDKLKHLHDEVYLLKNF
jgi:hypothetical protein